MTNKSKEQVFLSLRFYTGSPKPLRWVLMDLLVFSKQRATRKKWLMESAVSEHREPCSVARSIRERGDHMLP